MNTPAKRAANAVASALCLLPFGCYRIVASFSDRDRAFRSFSQAFSLLPGISGEYLRRAFYRFTIRSCAENCCISFGTIFSTPDVEIAEHVYIGAYCVIGKASIGKDTLIASRVSIPSGGKQHCFERSDIPIREQQRCFERVQIGKDCWIGEGAVITADVGDGAVIGAGSVVVKAVSPGMIAGGNPAKEIKSRKPAEKPAENPENPRHHGEDPETR